MKENPIEWSKRKIKESKQKMDWEAVDNYERILDIWERRLNG